MRGKFCGWVAQKKDMRLYRARFPRAIDAAQWLAAELNVPLENLMRTRIVEKRRKPSPTLLVSCHRGVVYHNGRWRAKDGSGSVLGRFSTEEQAAREVARALGTTPGKLGKERSVLWQRRIFSAALQVFSDYMPGDLESMVDHEKGSRRMFEQDHTAVMVSGCRVTVRVSVRHVDRVAP